MNKRRISNSFEIKSEIKFQMYFRRGAKSRVDNCDDEACHISHRNYLYEARFHRRKLRQTIYKLRVTTVQPELLLIIPQRIITVPPYFTVQFILWVQRITIHLYPPVIVENILYPSLLSCWWIVRLYRYLSSQR